VTNKDDEMTTKPDQHEHDEDLLKEGAAADFLGVEPGTLAVWRCTKRYPLKYAKIGRLIRYRRGDLRSFAASRVVG